ncbi:MAG: flavodoxin-dependent (E)-4-hydroxy-3-methylbut-2-enyl-diphosphate synthase [Clostridia bacterium]|nr:flavodoxin-dependent (E)-4-hydroxy-3-methylbut-2-enyl-diphosphate synthase [Clostridia bacterium]
MSDIIQRRKSRQVSVGDVKIGGDAPITVQSMLNAKTVDVDACLKQIADLRAVGCDLIRLAVPDEKSAFAFGEIARRTGLPLIADIHYNYRLAHLALDNGAKKIRMNPGNMQNFAEIKPLAERMKDMGVPVRVGVNGGSLDDRFKGMNEADALAESALECANVFEAAGMHDIVIAIKSSNTLVNVEANRKLAAACDYPLHIGVTEAGTLRTGLVKSSIGIGTLLQEGIGDTIRVSLSTNVVEEVLAGKKILQTLGIRKNAVEVVACPTCARTEIDVEALANKVELLTTNVNKPLTISILGCPLNGIGEGENSDLGIAGGKEKSVIMKDGKVLKTVKSSDLLDEFEKLLNEII